MPPSAWVRRGSPYRWHLIAPSMRSSDSIPAARALLRDRKPWSVPAQLARRGAGQRNDRRHRARSPPGHRSRRRSHLMVPVCAEQLRRGDRLFRQQQSYGDALGGDDPVSCGARSVGAGFQSAAKLDGHGGHRRRGTPVICGHPAQSLACRLRTRATSSRCERPHALPEARKRAHLAAAAAALLALGPRSCWRPPAYAAVPLEMMRKSRSSPVRICLRLPLKHFGIIFRGVRA